MHQIAERPRPAEARGWWRAVVGWVPALVLVVAFWWLVSGSDLARGFVPQLPAVWDEAARLTRTGVLPDAAAQTTGRLLAGLALGAGLGMGLVRVGQRSVILRSVLHPVIALGRAVPSVAWLALVAVVGGTSDSSTLVAVALVTASVSSDGPSAPAEDLQRVPLVSRAMLAQAWAVEVASEMLGADHGLGSLLRDGGFFERPERVFVAVIALATAGWATRLLLDRVQRLPLETLRPPAARRRGRIGPARTQRRERRA